MRGSYLGRFFDQDERVYIEHTCTRYVKALFLTKDSMHDSNHTGSQAAVQYRQSKDQIDRLFDKSERVYTSSATLRKLTTTSSQQQIRNKSARETEYFPVQYQI